MSDATNQTGAAPSTADLAKTVSSLQAEIAKISGVVENVAGMVAAGSQGVVSDAAGVVQDVAGVASAEASGDAQAAKQEEAKALDDIVSRLTQYEHDHSADIVGMIHTLWGRVFGTAPASKG